VTALDKLLSNLAIAMKNTLELLYYKLIVESFTALL